MHIYIYICTICMKLQLFLTIDLWLMNILVLCVLDCFTLIFELLPLNALMFDSCSKLLCQRKVQVEASPPGKTSKSGGSSSSSTSIWDPPDPGSCPPRIRFLPRKWLRTWSTPARLDRFIHSCIGPSPWGFLGWLFFYVGFFLSTEKSFSTRPRPQAT